MNAGSQVLTLLDRAGLREPLEELAGRVLGALDTRPPPPPVESLAAAFAAGDDPIPPALTESFRERFGEAAAYGRWRGLWCCKTRTVTPWSGEAYLWLRREAADWLAENGVNLAEPAALRRAPSRKGLDSAETPARPPAGGVDSVEGRGR